MQSPSIFSLAMMAVVAVSLSGRLDAASTTNHTAAPAPLNLTAILEKGGQFTMLIRMLKETQVGMQLQNQLNNSYDGMTLFAPTDNGFTNLKPGTLNSLDPQQQVNLILFHIIPRYLSDNTFATTSNPVRTQASDSDGPYTLNITTSGTGTNPQVNVSTGVDQVQLDSPLYSDFPLAVYPVDKVLLPNALFGPKPPAASVHPPTASKNPDESTKKPSADAPAAPATVAPSAAPPGFNLLWRSLAGVAGLALVINGLF